MEVKCNICVFATLDVLHFLIYFPDDIEAYHDAWIIGDEFLRDCSNTLKSMKHTSQISASLKGSLSSKAKQTTMSQKYFLHQNYNVRVYYSGSGVCGANRLIYPLVDALNSNHKLPQYIIIVPDKDMTTTFRGTMFNTGIMMGSTIHYIIRQFEMYVDRRHQDIDDKKPGALTTPDYPIFVWVRMLKRPPSISSDNTHHPVFSMRGKFNSVLEEQLLNGKDNKHKIMSVDVRMDEFDLQGTLTSAGKMDFWHEVDKAMKKFVAGDIKLLPRKFQGVPQTAKAAPAARSLPIRLLPSKMDHQDFIRRIAEVHRRHSQPHSRRRLWSPDKKRDSTLHSRQSRSHSRDHRHGRMRDAQSSRR